MELTLTRHQAYLMREAVTGLANVLDVMVSDGASWLGRTLADVVDDVITLAMRDTAGRVTLTTYKIDEHWWLADERARDLALPASMDQAATAQADREISADDGTVVTIRASH